MNTMSSLAIGLTAILASLRCFGNHRTTYWRFVKMFLFIIFNFYLAIQTSNDNLFLFSETKLKIEIEGSIRW